MHQAYYQFRLLGEVFQGLPLCFQLDELLLTLGARMSPCIHHCQPRRYLCRSQFPGSQSSSFLAYSFVSVEHILQSLLRKDMWDEFLETLHIWKCLILGWLISLGIEFQVVNYFPPENLRVLFYCLLASRIAVKRRKLFSFLIFSNWKLRESSFGSQSSDISWQCALAWVYFYLLCWTLCESWKSRKVLFMSLIFSKIILLMISYTPIYFFSFWDYNYLKMELLDKSSGFSFFFSPIVLICHFGRTKPYLPSFAF